LRPTPFPSPPYQNGKEEREKIRKLTYMEGSPRSAKRRGLSL
jgi:hypothetical protein